MGHPTLNELKSKVLDPAGKLRDVISDAPRLANVVARLESDRQEILAAFDHLLAGLQAAQPIDHRAADDLVSRLTSYRQKAADLLHQAYGVDLGGET
jgi:hypothetical protein